MKDVLAMEKGGYRDGWKEENISDSHTDFPSMHGRHNTLLNRIVLHDSAWIELHYSIFLV
jgi:hypothetical protein